MTVQAFFDRALLNPVEWPGKTTRLLADSLLDQLNRASSPNVSPAELYHENSKLDRHRISGLAAGRVDVAAVREEFIHSRSSSCRGPVAGLDDISGQIMDLIDSVIQALDIGLFFAVEMRVVTGSGIWFHDPHSRQLFQLIHESRSLDIVGEALHLSRHMDRSPEAKGPDHVYLLLIASFARNASLFGERGYRRTLLEAGQLGETVITYAAAGGWTTRLTYEFADRSIDNLNQIDGIEEGTIAVIDLLREPV